MKTTMGSIREIGENIKNSPLFVGLVAFDVPLAERTTMRVGGSAALLVEPESPQAAALAVAHAHEAEMPMYVLGGGSNLIFSDNGFHGMILSTARMNSIKLEPANCKSDQCGPKPATSQQSNEACPVLVTCGAGATIQAITEHCIKNGITSFSHFSGLPGTAGGAAYMNARCYETNASDIIHSITYIDLDKITKNGLNNIENLLQVYHNKLQDWSYKHSPFMDMHTIIVQVQFSCECVQPSVLQGAPLAPETHTAIKAQYDHFVQDRVAKGHFRFPSSGSVFKNNRSFGKPSGQLIDEVGLKGIMHGGAQIAPWHGNFIINTGTASASDIKTLVEQTRLSVKAQTGFLLECEIIFV